MCQLALFGAIQYHQQNYDQHYEYRFPSLFAVDRDRHFGPRILNSQIKSPILTEKLLFWTFFVDVNKRIRR